ncbi:hypothetical protein [Fusobacterium sp. PH5-44]|uniref:hypothetical protein n=1 Tax=unclassified Fusobacterium TaxID=2648384 RepID=UPI003D1ADA42
MKEKIKDYTIEMVIDEEKVEKYEEYNDNVMTIKIYDENNKEITKGKKVLLFLSKNGMLGFGTELIRYTNRYGFGQHEHLEAAKTKDELIQGLGVYVTPGSAEMIVICDRNEPIEEFYAKDEK